MPEGHSVHRLARQFTAIFAGERLQVSSPQGRFAPGAAQLDGGTLETAIAHGKQMFLRFDNDRVLRIHLGLYGKWSFGGDAGFRSASTMRPPRGARGPVETTDDDGQVQYVGPPEPVGAVRVRLVSEHGWADLRGPTACEVITAAEEKAARAKLGPDPLQPRPDGSAFVRKVTSSITPVGIQLMNQAVIAGIGNIYRAEVLFLQGINPYRPGKQLREDEAMSIWADTVRLMRDGVKEGKIITTTAEARNGRPKRTAPNYVYKRTGLPCRRCGTDILTAVMAARNVFWCPQCQAE